jgi:hypothetical protein
MTEVKYDRGHHAGGTPEQRVASRLKNSGDAANADHVIHKGGDAPNRTITNVFHAGHKIQPGTLPDKDAGR